jgi:hypothetical protein
MCLLRMSITSCANIRSEVLHSSTAASPLSPTPPKRGHGSRRCRIRSAVTHCPIPLPFANLSVQVRAGGKKSVGREREIKPHGDYVPSTAPYTVAGGWQALTWSDLQRWCNSMTEFNPVA